LRREEADAMTLVRKSAVIAAFVLAPLLAACTSQNIIPDFRISSQQPQPPNPGVRDARFAFAPITGAPAELLMQLSDELNDDAAVRSLSVVPYGDPEADYTIKGYLSAVGGSSGTIIVYVWDIVDQNGNRLHRLSGQESSNESAPDPWLGVTGDTLSLVAQRTIDGLAAWVSQQAVGTG
jgi:hypothetical protein